MIVDIDGANTFHAILARNSINDLSLLEPEPLTASQIRDRMGDRGSSTDKIYRVLSREVYLGHLLAKQLEGLALNAPGGLDRLRGVVCEIIFVKNGSCDGGQGSHCSHELFH